VRAWGSWDEVEPQVIARRRSWPIILSAETAADPSRHVTLSSRVDRFGDPFAHVHYDLIEFDHETFSFARRVHDQIASAVRADATQLSPNPHRFGSGAHHMGGCATSLAESDGVVDSFGRIHGCDNVYVAGSSIFPGSSGAVNPTLTLLALALRGSEHLVASIRSG
jgi:choline dehydrogenase-like flavoprotein